MCVNTISALKVGVRPNGKAVLKIFKKRRSDGSDFHFLPADKDAKFVQLPCGQCIECRLERSRIWAIRCMHEASLYENNCFITLTFNDEYVDRYKSLRPDTYPKFMKRLRKAIYPSKVRFFHAAEYGENFGRPHHHAILFGYDFPDKIHKTRRNNYDYFESPLLSKLWTHPETGESLGFHEITSVSFDSCAYVARYCVKKITGPAAYDHYQYLDESGSIRHRKPEFCTMSRGKPCRNHQTTDYNCPDCSGGIGAKWYARYKDSDVWAHDRVHIEGSTFITPPRYYLQKLELSDKPLHDTIKNKRKIKLKESTEFTAEKQTARELIKKAQLSLTNRKLV